MPKMEKAKIVKELKEKLNRSKSFFLTDFTGLNVQEMTDLRKEFKAKKVDYLVSKNTLIELATKELNLNAIAHYLKGPTGMAFSYDDPIVPAKVLYDFNKRLNKPRVKVFWVEGNVYKEGELGQLAKLPSREILYSQIVGSLDSVIGNLVGSLDGVFREFIGTVEALNKTKNNN
ncbi:MAG: 50S ribosomal protein L10 [candidate division Zixibacteria bacterium]|nr:50S ribosomal protein L10 [candidate division Zixibacteria bacterium]